jgi:hypothetical protein
MKRRVNLLEPYGPVYNGNLAAALWLDGQTDAAIALWKDNLSAEGSGAQPGLAEIYASLGRYQDAADITLQMLSVERYQRFRPQLELFPRLLRTAPSKAARSQTLPSLSDWSFIFFHIGAPERVLDRFDDPTQGYTDISLMWHPTYASLRKTARFKEIVRDMGLVTYWRERGWPSFCRPTSGDDFACQ